MTNEPKMTTEPEVSDVLSSLLASSKNPAEILELYYWSQEEGMTEFIRAVTALPETSRGALMDLFRNARDKKAIRANANSDGSLTLMSCRLGQMLSPCRMTLSATA